VRVPQKHQMSAEVPRHTKVNYNKMGFHRQSNIRSRRREEISWRSRAEKGYRAFTGGRPKRSSDGARKLGFGGTARAVQRRCTGAGCGGGDGERWHRLWGRFLQRRRSGGARAEEKERRCAWAAAMEKKRRRHGCTKESRRWRGCTEESRWRRRSNGAAAATEDRTALGLGFVGDSRRHTWMKKKEK
jgi:hypothetical protein